MELEDDGGDIMCVLHFHTTRLSGTRSAMTPKLLRKADKKASMWCTLDVIDAVVKRQPTFPQLGSASEGKGGGGGA